MCVLVKNEIVQYEIRDDRYAINHQTDGGCDGLVDVCPVCEHSGQTEDGCDREPRSVETRPIVDEEPDHPHVLATPCGRHAGSVLLRLVHDGHHSHVDARGHARQQTLAHDQLFAGDRCVPDRAQHGVDAVGHEEERRQQRRRHVDEGPVQAAAEQRGQRV